jgi:hypothetical protein
MIVNLRMSEVIDYLWKYDPLTFDVQRMREQEWIWVMGSDRASNNPPALRDHFVTMMMRALATHQIRPVRWISSSLPAGSMIRPRVVLVSG